MFGTNRLPQVFLLLLLASFGVGFAIEPAVYDSQNGEMPTPLVTGDHQASNPNPNTIPLLLDALDVLQGEHFEVWQGIWPTSIDWTSAVVGTYLAAALSTLSSAFVSLADHKKGENIINQYFSQLVASYFGQNAFSLRQQAYDDMLWVVLGWLESIKFIKAHSETHYNSTESNTPWYGAQWIPAFAHRARLFWELASQGWDTSLCDGGMIWSPYLTPYENAITNELYIAASISMYLSFPGDNNTAPFMASAPAQPFYSTINMVMEQEAPAHDPKYLAAAVDGYKWLKLSNMTDSKGLYVDGYHVSGWSRDRAPASNNTKCDARNEMVYTYNQGVLLTGQRGLYEATGVRSYLEDGHKLISDVISATGWDLRHDTVMEKPKNGKLGEWHGLGRSGIMEEACDAAGDCSQDSQTFKGIFFHHLTTFCLPLPAYLTLPESHSRKAVSPIDEQVQEWHKEKCGKYRGWITNNAQAALTTKNRKGRFGMWWGAPASSDPVVIPKVVLPADAVDYKNQGIPVDWQEIRRTKRASSQREVEGDGGDIGAKDYNERGRGRTVETQGGGVSVLRALWEIVDTKT